MAEKISYSTQNLVLSGIQCYPRFDLGNTAVISEGVGFTGDRNGVATIFRDSKTDVLRSLDNVVHDLEAGVTVYYDHNYWAAPFGNPGFDPDPNGPYKAVIAVTSIERSNGGNLKHRVHYGTFWYDQMGEMKAVDGGAINQSKYESIFAPSLKFRRVEGGNWQIFRLAGVQEPSLSYLLEGKVTSPEKGVIINGQEVIVDEMFVSLTDDSERFKLQQRTRAGHKQKTIEVPSRIDIPRWAEGLSALGGGWVRALSEFPTKVELVV